MKYGANARHFLGCGRVEFGYLAVSNGRLDRHAIEQARKMVVRSILRFASNLQRPIHTPRVAANG